MIRKIITSKILFFILVTIVILGLNITPLALQYRHSPPGRTFGLIHNNVQDFYFYQSLMNEGANGNWIIYDPYTTEPHLSSPIFSYFAWLGKVSRLLNIRYAVMYHILRLTASFAFLTVAYLFLHFIKVPNPNLTYFFFLFATPVMKSKEPYMYWWTGMDSVRRAAYLPHHMIGALLLVTIAIFLLKFTQDKKLKYLLISILAAPILSFIHTPSLFILLLTFPPTVIAYQILRMRLSPIHLIGFLTFWLMGLFSLILMVSQTNKGFPWSQYLEWEVRLQFPLQAELIPALGPIFPLSLLGILYSFMSRKFNYLFIAFWFMVPFLLIPLAPAIKISNIRLIQGVPFLTMAILAGFGIKTLGNFSSSLFGKIIHKPSDRLSKLINRFLFILILAVFFYFSIPTTIFSIKDQIREYWPIYGNVYIDNRLYNAFAYINKNYPPKTVTLATFYAGNYLPAFTNTISFIGHSGYTADIDKKQKLVEKFFQNKMKDQEAKEFILNNKIVLVFQGPEEKILYNKILYSSFLKPVYNKEEATLYIVTEGLE